MFKTKIRRIGNSAGTTIPKDFLEKYHLSEGDEIFVVETEKGLLITPFDPNFAEFWEAYEEGSSTFRNAMRELAD